MADPAPDPGTLAELHARETPGVAALFIAVGMGFGCALTDVEARDVYAEIERLRVEAAAEGQQVSDLKMRLYAVETAAGALRQAALERKAEVERPGDTDLIGGM